MSDKNSPDDLGGFTAPQIAAITRMLYEHQALQYLETETRELREELEKVRAELELLKTAMADQTPQTPLQILAVRPNAALKQMREICRRYIEATGNGGEAIRRVLGEYIIDLGHPQLQSEFGNLGMSYLDMKVKLRATRREHSGLRKVTRSEREFMQWKSSKPHSLVIRIG